MQRMLRCLAATAALSYAVADVQAEGDNRPGILPVAQPAPFRPAPAPQFHQDPYNDPSTIAGVVLNAQSPLGAAMSEFARQHEARNSFFGAGSSWDTILFEKELTRRVRERLRPDTTGAEAIRISEEERVRLRVEQYIRTLANDPERLGQLALYLGMANNEQLYTHARWQAQTGVDWYTSTETQRTEALLDLFRRNLANNRIPRVLGAPPEGQSSPAPSNND